MENINEKIADDLFDKVIHGDKNSFQELEKLAEKGNARAMSKLAQIYLNGFGIVESSYEKAVALFQKAAALDEVYALFRLGKFYRDAKYGFKQDGHKAAEYFMRAAEHATPNGAAEGLKLAAEIYRYGKGGVTPDAQKAIELYEKLAELESRGEAEPRLTGDKALLKLAEIYTEGCGSLKPDARKALEYLLKVDDKFALINFYCEDKAGIKPDGYKVIEYLGKLGFRHMERIAEIYRDGKYNVKADGYKAVEYFLKKAECEFIAGSLKEDAELYLENSFDNNEHNNAVEYCSEAKEICNVDVFQEIAEIFLEGKGGVQPDGYKALEYFSKAAEAINCIIDFTKNYIEDNGEIKEERQDFFNRVFYWLVRDNKNISEQIAKIYTEGKAGVQPDGQKAVEYHLKAIEAEHDNPNEIVKSNNISSICNKIAWIYLEGCGDVQSDGCKAIEYFERSSDFEKIAEIYRYGKAGVEPDPRKAVEYFLKYEVATPGSSNDETDEFSVFLNNERRAKAFRNIAEIYFKLNDGQKALEYFLKADEFGDEWAYIEVERIYREGKGNLKPDGVKLIEYLTKKLEQGKYPDDIILYDIAKAYEEGCGSLLPNRQKALEFYGKSAALGNDYAKERLTELTGSDE